MDPVFSWTLRAALALLFATSALHKARAPRAFVAALRSYRLLPHTAAPAFSLGLLASELALTVALLLPAAAGRASLGAAALLALYSGAIAINLARGRRDVDCGCLGPGHRQPLTGWLLARNGLLIGLALAAALPQTTRALHWVDALSFLGALATASLLFAAVQGTLGRSAIVQPTRPIGRSA